MPNVPKIVLKNGKKFISKRNLSREFSGVREESSKSMREKNFKKPRKHKNSVSQAGDKFRLPKFSIGRDLNDKYKAENKELTRKLEKSKENEKMLIKRIQKLEAEQEAK